MLAITILMLAAAPATHHVRAAHPAPAVYHGRLTRKARRFSALTSKLQVVTARATPKRSPYRLPLDLAPEPTAKDIALNEDGTRCALIGQTICTDPPPVLMTIGEKPFALLPELAP